MLLPYVEQGPLYNAANFSWTCCYVGPQADRTNKRFTTRGSPAFSAHPMVSRGNKILTAIPAVSGRRPSSIHRWDHDWDLPGV